MLNLEEVKRRSDKLSHDIVGAAIEVHRELGPGLLESAYEGALSHEFDLRKISYVRQQHLPVVYKNVNLKCNYRIDLLVEDLVVIELKSVERIEPLFEAQLITYLRLTGRWLGMLLNFNVPVMKEGIKRIVNG